MKFAFYAPFVRDAAHANHAWITHGLFSNFVCQRLMGDSLTGFKPKLISRLQIHPF
jgi:hypothetical protein